MNDLSAPIERPAAARWASASARDRERSSQAGFSDHLAKPIELTRLERLLAAR